MSSNRTNGTKPAIQHTKSILDDRRIRLLLAIVGAIVAWMVVTIIVQPGTTRTINNVPVDFTFRRLYLPGPEHRQRAGKVRQPEALGRWLHHRQPDFL